MMWDKINSSYFVQKCIIWMFSKWQYFSMEFPVCFFGHCFAITMTTLEDTHFICLTVIAEVSYYLWLHLRDALRKIMLKFFVIPLMHCMNLCVMTKVLKHLQIRIFLLRLAVFYFRCLCWHNATLPPPTADQWKSLKPAAGTCIVSPACSCACMSDPVRVHGTNKMGTRS